MDEIVNKVANSALEVFDLEDYYQKGIRTEIDLSQWLLEGFLLREKDFRASLLEHDWSQYRDHFVAISCSTDASYFFFYFTRQTFCNRTIWRSKGH